MSFSVLSVVCHLVFVIVSFSVRIVSFSVRIVSFIGGIASFSVRIELCHCDI